MLKSLKTYFLGTVILFACNQPQEQGIKYELHSKNKKILEIQAKDIVFYDTTQIRGDIEIHELRLKNNFFKKDSFILTPPPLTLYCIINDVIYFKADLFYRKKVSS